MRHAIVLAVAMVAAVIAVPDPRRQARRPVIRYGPGGEFETREGALFALYMLEN